MRQNSLKLCFLVCPSAEIGGGMGQFVEYLLSLRQCHDIPFRLVAIDPRGPGHIAYSPFYLASAVLRIFLRTATRQLGLVHLNVAERSSLFRKGIIAYVAHGLGVPVLLHLHAAELRSFYEHLPSLGQRFVRGFFVRADVCVVLGKVWQDWLVERLEIKASRIVVLRNGVPRIAENCRRASGDTFRILFLGNLMVRKGVADLLGALADPLLADCDFKATFAGGGDVETYRRQAEGLGLGERVRFTGWLDREQVAVLTAAADVLVLPSYHEGLPLVILEALGAGTPVICTPVGSIPEVLEDECTALFVPPGGRTEIAAALRRLIDNPEFAAELAAAGRKLYESEFTMEVFISRLSALYRSFNEVTV